MFRRASLRRLAASCVLACAWMVALSRPVAAQDGRPPTVDAAASAQADAVRGYSDADPVGRIQMLLAARSLSPAAQFALAQTHPSIVEQLIDPKLAPVLAYLDTLPAPELARLRQGKTVVRAQRDLKGAELAAAAVVAQRFDWPKFKPEKITAVRLGPFEGRTFRMDITYAKSKKKEFTNVVELAWPSSPERDEESRGQLSKHFGARPSRDSNEKGAPLPLIDGSFEKEYTLNDAWELVEATEMGNKRTPVNDVTIDATSALDGAHSVRFYADDHTRLFNEVAQLVPVMQFQPVQLRAQLKAENLRIEFHQREDQVCMTLSFLDANYRPVGQPVKAVGRLTTHPWELLELTATAPANAAFARVALLSAVSGTAWFDAVELRRAD